MKHLFVWVRCEDGTLKLAGELAATEPDGAGRFASEFEYASTWVNDPAAFPLDPVSLPFGSLPRGSVGLRFRSDNLHPPLAVFDDALPDDWGRRLLATQIKLEGRRPTPMELLLCMQGRGTGALVLTAEATTPRIGPTLESTALRDLLSAASKYEAGTLPTNHEFRRLLEGSSRAGGARPKALVHDSETEWVAKFPSRSRDGTCDVVGLEAVCLQLAARAGLEVPTSKLLNVGRRRVLLVRRFDVTPANGRVHMISMRTLCKERPGVFATSYAELAQVLSKYSAAPQADIAALFRHMVFNAAIGNVDDHLKNFWMLAMPAGYRLAPAFDLVPDVTGRGEHTLAFEYGLACPSNAELLRVGAAWRVVQASSIIAEVVDATRSFASLARRLEVRGAGALDRIIKDVRRRCDLLAGRKPRPVKR